MAFSIIVLLQRSLLALQFSVTARGARRFPLAHVFVAVVRAMSWEEGKREDE